MAPENSKPTSDTRSKAAMKRRTSETSTRGKEKLESASESREGGGPGAAGFSPWAAAVTSRMATKCRLYQTKTDPFRKPVGGLLARFRSAP